MATTLDFSPDGPGDVFIEDDGIADNATGQARSGSGAFATFSFAYPADLLTLTYAAGQVAFLDLTDSLGVANPTAGNPGDTSKDPDAIEVRRIETAGIVTLSTTGDIVEWGSDTAVDIAAGNLGLKAVTGIGK